MVNQIGEFHTTTPVVMVYPAVVEPKKFKDARGDEKGEAKYSAQFLFDPTSADFLALKDVVLAVAKAKWPRLDIGAAYREGKLHLPWAMGDKQISNKVEKLSAQGKEYTGADDFRKGKVVVSADTKKFRPALGYIANGQIIDLLDDAAVQLNRGKFYSGVEAYCQFNLVAYEGVGATGVPGVKAYLQSVVSTGKGKPLGRTASQTFSGYIGRNSTENPTTDPDDDLL